ncbi:hypothetical protein [Streptomyces sp. NBC_00989]|nr:hypothetical protein OG714_52430 [Streptomyces sp. NBC_00989]
MVFTRTREDANADGTFITIPPAAGTAVGIKMPLIITADAREEFGPRS